MSTILDLQTQKGSLRFQFLNPQQIIINQLYLQELKLFLARPLKKWKKRLRKERKKKLIGKILVMLETQYYNCKFMNSLSVIIKLNPN